MTVMTEQPIQDSQVRAVLAQLPEFAQAEPAWDWLSGGGAHKNFLVTASQRRAVVKLWNTMWEGVGVIPPAPVIMQNTIIAGELGVGAPVLAVVNVPLALVIEYLPERRPLAIEQPQAIPRLAAAARRLHDSGARFNNDYNAFAEARKMLAAARQRGVDLPDGFAELQREVNRVEHVLDLRVNDFVPCHNDLYGSNILENASGEIRLVDYDLSGNGDRYYDLGFTSAYFEMNLDQIHRLCESYFGEVNDHQVARARLFAVPCNWACLALWLVALSMADTNDDYDYQGELENSLRRLHTNLDAPDFGAQLKLAAR